MIHPNKRFYAPYKVEKVADKYELVGKKRFLVNSAIANFIEILKEPFLYADFLEKIAKNYQTSVQEIETATANFLERMFQQKIVIYETQKPPQPKFKVGEVLDNRYLIDKQVLKTGKHQVLLATDLEQKRKVAIKLFLFSKAEIAEFKKEKLFHRFSQEYQKAKSFGEHKNICKYLDFEENDNIYFVLEYLSGRNLRKICESKAESLAKRVIWAMQLIESVAFLHEQGGLHGDLHAANFISDENENLKLIDFDFSFSPKIENVTWVNGGVYTYLPPERIQLHQNQVFTENYGNTQSEVYQIGVMLYFLFAHKLPFQARTWEKLSKKIREKIPKPIFKASLEAEENALQTEISAIIFQCLEKEPEKRPNSAVELCQKWEKLAQKIEI